MFVLEIFLAILVTILQLLTICMFIAMLMSWIDPSGRFPFTRFVRGIVNPLFTPFRNIIPVMGVIDLSFIFAWIMLVLMTELIRQVGVKGFLPF